QGWHLVPGGERPPPIQGHIADDGQVIPKEISGCSESICMACNAQGQGTIKVVELTTPSWSERRMPALQAWDLPKSSALMINKRASSGYPNKRLVSLLCDWAIFHVSLLDCFVCSIPVVLLSIKHFSSNGYASLLALTPGMNFL